MPHTEIDVQLKEINYESFQNYTREAQKSVPTLRRIIRYKRPNNAKFYPPYFCDLADMRMKPVGSVSFDLKEAKVYSLVPVSTKLVHAAFKRSNSLTDRVLRLSWKQSEIRRKLIIFHHLQVQKAIQLKAGIEYKQILATMRRQSYLWKRVEQSAMRVEKAITICNLRKLQKAQAERRLTSKNMVKRMTDNADMLSHYTGAKRPKSKAPLSVQHLMPPISRFTLRELDVTEIYSNMQLRHDLVFDSDMQFRPNIDGDKGAVKALKAAQYWNEIKEEILSANEGSGPFKKMPVLINEIVEIMLEMFQDSTDMVNTLKKWDIDAIMEELYADMGNGTPYIIKIAKVMHIYCAPCRDEMIDDMVALYQSRFHVDALNKCLSILEHMRLDFANHNLRKLRPLLVTKSTQFEWRYFQQKQIDKKLTISHTRQWIKSSLLEFKKTDHDKSNFYEFAMMQIITNSYMSETGKSLPETFLFDINRINTFHNDYQDIAIMNTLLVLFKQFTGPKCTSTHLQQLKKVLWLLLNDSQTTMENVTCQMINDATTVRNFPLTPNEKNLLIKLVDSTLSIDSQVYLVIQSKTADSLLHHLINNSFNIPLLKSTLLIELEPELLDLATKLKKLVVHNQSTYQQLYSKIVSQVNL